MSEKSKLLEERSDDFVLEDQPQLHESARRRRALILIVLLFGNCLFLLGPLSFLGSFYNGDKKGHGYRYRAEKLLKSHPLVDGHEDFLISIRAHFDNQLYTKNFTSLFEKGGLQGQLDIPRIKEGHYGGAFWSAFWPCQNDISDFSDQSYEPVIRNTLNQIDTFQRLSIMYPKYFTPSHNAKAAHHQFSKGHLISPLAIEGLHQVGNSSAMSLLRLYHSLGVRYATLTWNCHNPFADAALLTHMSNGSTVKAEPLHGGVSSRGRTMIKEMNRMGMIVDLSHTSVDTMRDVLIGDHRGGRVDGWSGSLAPPIFSHSSAYAICPHPRNVPDDVLQLVKERNSVIMINFNPGFISCLPLAENSTSGVPDFYPPNSTLKHVVKHIRHIGELVGYSHVGIGTDFDGIEEVPAGLEDVSKFPDLVAELLRQGVHEKDVVKVIGGNILRVWGEVDEVSKRLQRKGVLPAEDEARLDLSLLKI